MTNQKINYINICDEDFAADTLYLRCMDLALSALAKLDDATESGAHIVMSPGRTFAFNLTFDNFRDLANNNVTVDPVIFDDNAPSMVEEVVYYEVSDIPSYERRQLFALEIYRAIKRVKGRYLASVREFEDFLTMKAIDDPELFDIEVLKETTSIQDVRFDSYILRASESEHARLVPHITEFFGGFKPLEVYLEKDPLRDAVYRTYFDSHNDEYLEIAHNKTISWYSIDDHLCRH